MLSMVLVMHHGPTRDFSLGSGDWDSWSEAPGTRSHLTAPSVEDVEIILTDLAVAIEIQGDARFDEQ